MTSQQTEDHDARASMLSAARWHSHLRLHPDKRAQEFFDWIRLSPRNRRAFEAVDMAWRIAGGSARDPEIMALRREALEQTEPPLARTDWRRYAALAAAFCMVAILCGFFFYSPAWLHRSSGQRLADRQVIQTDFGQRSAIELDDGSRVTLDYNSRLELVDTVAGREARLTSGQASFEIVQRHDRPFTVTANGSQIQVMGTVFNVELMDETVQVALAEGKIKFEPPPSQGRRARNSKPVIMRPGQVLQARDGAISVTEANVQNEFSWKNGRLRFFNTPIADALTQMSRYSRLSYRLTDSAADYRVSGTFRTSSPDAFITTITETLPLSAHREGDVITIDQK